MVSCRTTPYCWFTVEHSWCKRIAGRYGYIANGHSLQIQPAIIDLLDLASREGSTFEDMVHDITIVDSLDLRDISSIKPEFSVNQSEEVS